MTCQRAHANLEPGHRCYQLRARPWEPCFHEWHQNDLQELNKTKAKSQRPGPTSELPNLQRDWEPQRPGTRVSPLKPLFFIHQTCRKHPLLPWAEHSQGQASPTSGWGREDLAGVKGAQRRPESWLPAEVSATAWVPKGKKRAHFLTCLATAGSPA